VGGGGIGSALAQIDFPARLISCREINLRLWVLDGAEKTDGRKIVGYKHHKIRETS